MSKFVKDLVERVSVVAAVAFLSTFSLSDLSTLKSAAIAAGSAAAQFVIGVLSKRYGNPDKAGVTK